MKKLISERIAGIILIVMMSLLIIFHLLIIFRVLPSDMVWGGKLENSSQVLMMELIALVITILFLTIILLKLSRTQKIRKLINVAVWIIFIYFSLNVLGNLASENTVEKAVLTPVALIMALLTLRLALEK
jgi:heme/copper-type cytochrome/quinol oxidase subunit 4